MFCSVYVVCLVTNECGAGDGGDAVRGANAGLDHFSQVDSSASVSGKTRHSCRERNKHTTTKPLTKTHLPPPSSPRAPASHAYIELLNLTDDVPLLPGMTHNRLDRRCGLWSGRGVAWLPTFAMSPPERQFGKATQRPRCVDVGACQPISSACPRKNRVRS